MQSKALLEADSQPFEPSVLGANGTAQAVKQAAPVIKKGVHLLIWGLLGSLILQTMSGDSFLSMVLPQLLALTMLMCMFREAAAVIDHCANSVLRLLCSQKQEAEAHTARLTTSWAAATEDNTAGFSIKTKSAQVP